MIITESGGGGGLLVKRSDPLASREVIRIEDLDGLPFVTQGSGFDIHEYLMERCKMAGVKPNIVFQSSNFVDILSLVWIHKAATYSFANDPEISSFADLTCVPFDNSFVDWNAYLIAKKGHMDYIAEVFIKHGENPENQSMQLTDNLNMLLG